MLLILARVPIGYLTEGSPTSARDKCWIIRSYCPF